MHKVVVEVTNTRKGHHEHAHTIKYIDTGKFLHYCSEHRCTGHQLIYYVFLLRHVSQVTDALLDTQSTMALLITNLIWFFSNPEEYPPQWHMHKKTSKMIRMNLWISKVETCCGHLHES